MADGHCSCCITHLNLGPRAKRILLYLTRHPDWERDHLSGVHFEFLYNGNDHTRVTYQEVGRKMFEEAA
jgi:hypothetical protein